MARTVIADAGPLIALASIDLLTLLKELFDEVFITRSVRDECLAKPSDDGPQISVAIEDGWLKIVTEAGEDQPLSPSLGIGESDSIRFALQEPEDSLLIMDDRLARRYALKRGLNIVGTVRLLDLAERQTDSAERQINEMAECGYRVSVDLLKKIRSG
ncbi:MAG: DUF3368 domain-containing protein [Gammaproteobacteria bacterium]|nr:DUF3368 domain-containing protein [Gammaproteobacteria bacterium]